MPGTASLAEMAVVALVLVTLLALQLVLSEPLYFFERNFWVDELSTFAIVTDPDLGHGLRALADHVDGNPPTLHLLLRAFTALTCGASEETVRAFAFLSVVVALLGIYAALRQAFSGPTAFTAVLAIWCHPLVIHHAFEGRFYGPWLAAAVWFAYLLSRSPSSGRKGLWNVLLAASAVLLCTIHYFGIFSFALITGFEFLFHCPVKRFTRTNLAAIALGPLALLACMPFYLGQEAALTVPTWLDPPSVEGVIEFGGDVLFPRYLAGILLVPWLFFLLQARGPDPRPEPRPSQAAALAGMSGLVLLPVVLIVFSLAIQPVLLGRYAIPAVAALAPAVGFLVARTSRVWAVGLCLFFVLVGTRTLMTECVNYQDEEQKTQELISAIRNQTGTAPVAFESSHELSVVCRYAPDLADRCYFLDFERGQIGLVDNRRIILRDLSRKVAENYGKPALISWDALRHLPKHYVVLDTDGYQERIARAGELYPGFTPAQIEHHLYELVPEPADQGGGREQPAGGAD
jgi:hypothetical protein